MFLPTENNAFAMNFEDLFAGWVAGSLAVVIGCGEK
jgi:hypothetical protein